ncbi:SAM-dependent methyltransferase [Spirillospora sp. CA-128828]|uniref:SAM-dependent methyltransferase n=1 Tax=Spirillospora sp. CA-128828 TaxID=3240033 RepID=UPI003D92362E
MTSDATGRSGLDHGKASLARVYNYYLRGKDWSSLDEETAQAVIRSAPDVPEAARENFRFAGRAAAWAVAEHQIRQVVDIGVGIVNDLPLPSVETCVLEVDPGATVLAFDNDEVVLAHARALRRGYGGVLRGDVTDLDGIFKHPDAVGLIDMAEPLVVILAAVLHFVPDAAAVMVGLRERLAPGSVVVLSHVTSTQTSERRVAGMTKAYDDKAVSPIFFRSQEEIRAPADGWDIVAPPGLVDVQRWSPDGTYVGPLYDTVRVLGMAAVLPGHQQEHVRAPGGAR